MSKKVNPNKYIIEYFKENEWTTLKGQEKKKYAYSKRNFKLIKSASKKVEISNFKWFGEEGLPRKKLCLSEKPETTSTIVKEEILTPTKEEEIGKKRDAFSNCREIAKVLFKGAKNNLKILENTLSSLGEESFDAEDTTGPRIKRCYPRRSLTQQMSYKEDDLTSEDEYLYCDDCKEDYKGACPDHGPMLHACDKEVPEESEEKATGSLPEFLSIGLSGMPKAGLGVWTEVPLPKGVVFGPYLGHITRNRKTAQNSGYAWQVWKSRKPLHFVEAAQTNESNWLRFVNCANSEDKQNLTAFQYKKQIYYRTYKPVLPYTELLVWYGDNYAEDLGIDTSNKALEPLGEIDGHQCEECSALFSTSEALSRHLKRHTQLGPDRKHKCPKCSYSTRNSVDLRNHMVAHSEDRAHACPECNKRFKAPSDLRRHKHTHQGVRRHSCDTCGKCFAGSSDLIRHRRTHTDERPFRCATCGRDFKQVVHLRRHERAHAAQRPYRCPHCDYRAIRRASLKSHIVYRHTREFKCMCPHCGKGFGNVKSLEVHVECKHFDTDTYRDIVTRRFHAGKDDGALGNIFDMNMAIKVEDSGTFEYRKETKFLPPAGVEFRKVREPCLKSWNISDGNKAIKVEDPGTFECRKKAEFLPPFKAESRKVREPWLKYLRIIEIGGADRRGIQSLEDLRSHIEKLNLKKSVKMESPDDDNNDDGEKQRSLRMAMWIRKDRYLDATQMPNLNVFADFRRL